MATRSKDKAPLLQGRTNETRLRYQTMLARGHYVRDVKKGKIKFDPEVLRLFDKEKQHGN